MCSGCAKGLGSQPASQSRAETSGNTAEEGRSPVVSLSSGNVKASVGSECGERVEGCKIRQMKASKSQHFAKPERLSVELVPSSLSERHGILSGSQYTGYTTNYCPEMLPSTWGAFTKMWQLPPSSFIIFWL